MICRDCGKDKEPQDYYASRRQPCKDCHRANQRAYKAKHQKEANAWARANRAKEQVRVNRWRQANIDKERLRYRVKQGKRRDALRGSFSSRDWQRLLIRHANRCAYCGNADRLTVDHVVPVSRGGSNTIGNVLPACAKCNGSKGTKLLVEWRVGGGPLRHSTP